MIIPRLLTAISAHSRTLRGQSFVEFALLLPVLLLLVLGTVDLGRAYFASVSLENAVKEGAFFGARDPDCATAGASCPDPNNVRARVDLELNGLTVNNFQAKCFAPGTTVFTGAGKALTACEDGDLYYVASETPFSLITPLISGLVGNTINLGSDATASGRHLLRVRERLGTDPDDQPAPEPCPGQLHRPQLHRGTRPRSVAR